MNNQEIKNQGILNHAKIIKIEKPLIINNLPFQELTINIVRQHFSSIKLLFSQINLLPYDWKSFGDRG